MLLLLEYFFRPAADKRGYSYISWMTQGPDEDNISCIGIQRLGVLAKNLTFGIVQAIAVMLGLGWLLRTLSAIACFRNLICQQGIQYLSFWIAFRTKSCSIDIYDRGNGVDSTFIKIRSAW
jgi:hypothetical protein